MASMIFVTGASSGIGRQLTLRLAALGCGVYATARKERDLQSLGSIAGVLPIPLDLRDPGAIAGAAGRVRAGGGILHGLVNNAGLGGIGPLVSWSDDELREIFEVNALAPVRLTRALLPFLIEAKGRIVNVGSQGGSTSKRHYGPYTMTKHALEAFNTALADELEPFGVPVSIVQPGGVRTEMGENSRAADLARFRRAPEPFAEEGRAIAAWLEELQGQPEGGPAASASSQGDAPAGAPSRADAPAEDRPESEANRKPADPDAVAEVILHALFDPRPQRRYLFGTRWEGNRVIDALLERLVDANACPSLGYSRDELVAWLDRKLEEGPRTA